MARQRKLREVLNVRLDEPLAREIRRIAASQDRTESEVARSLLHHGVEVSRQLEAQRLAEPFWAVTARSERRYEDDEPGVVDIHARWRPATVEELREMGWPGIVDDDDYPEQAEGDL